MTAMAGKNSNKFLPDSISGVLKAFVARVFGALVCVGGVWAVFAMLFYDPYLSVRNRGGAGVVCISVCGALGFYARDCVAWGCGA